MIVAVEGEKNVYMWIRYYFKVLKSTICIASSN